jgi:hypothetical protein
VTQRCDKRSKIRRKKTKSCYQRLEREQIHLKSEVETRKSRKLSFTKRFWRVSMKILKEWGLYEFFYKWCAKNKADNEALSAAMTAAAATIQRQQLGCQQLHQLQQKWQQPFYKIIQQQQMLGLEQQHV